MNHEQKFLIVDHCFLFQRTQRDNDILLQKGKIDKLEKLCRALQAERRKLKKELEKFDKVILIAHRYACDKGICLIQICSWDEEEEE